MKLSRTLLVIEDNPGDVRLLRETFSEEAWGDVSVTYAESMHEAEFLLGGNPFDVVLLDLGLSDAQGLTAVRRARAAAPRVALVVLTGHDDDSLAVEALKEGAQDYLVKGQIDTRGLRRALRYAEERKVMEEAVFAEAERCRMQTTALENTTDGVMITDHHGTITWVNQGFSKITGFSLEEAIGRKASILRSGQDDTATYADLKQTILDGWTWEGELTNMRPSGESYLVAQSITPVRDARGARGAVSQFVSVMRDISQQRRLEQQLRQSQKMEALGRLSGGVAHDFNNLLGVILGFGDMLLRYLPPDERFQRYCGEILKAANRGAGLTQQLLAFSRQQVLQPKVMSLNDVILESQKMLGRLLGEDVELVTSLDPELGHVRIDPGQIEQVVMNLSVNARDAMPQGGTLKVETTNIEHTEAGAGQYGYPVAMGSYVRLAVSDTGTGMDDATRAHIFEPFFTTKSLGKGTGLGPATVYGVVEQSKGHISVASKLGQGTCFTILLPRLARQAASVETDIREETSLRGTETVLLVEDDDAARSLWKEMLEDLGYRVLVASNGVEAIEKGRSCRDVALLLTDVVMPQMGGRELSELLANHCPGLRVIFMSGYTADTILRQGIAETGWPFLQKPFSPKQFARKVRDPGHQADQTSRLTMEDSLQESAGRAIETNRTGPVGRILVVDDSRLVRVMIAGYLRTAGFHVDEADGGAAALVKLTGGDYDVVVTDLQMPGLDGFDVLAAAKGLAQGVEVIVLTGAHSEDMGSAVRALRMGAHDYMTKPPPSAEEVVLTVERAMEKRQLREANRQLLHQLETLSLTDALTGVPNRRSFDRALEQEIARARRHDHPLGIVALDIDFFKNVNDTYGHEGGDTILRSFARIVASMLRKEDSLYRCGGEEFAVIVPFAHESGLRAAAGRIVEVVATSPIQVGAAFVSITTSAGAACLNVGDDAARLLSRADAALYEAKRSGRNRVCVDKTCPGGDDPDRVVGD